ncbi:hypothetical protein [Streptomyces rubellomurinus]|nr:hypothetical protein [Streptomyces rubellomurinus]
MGDRAMMNHASADGQPWIVTPVSAITVEQRTDVKAEAAPGQTTKINVGISNDVVVPSWDLLQVFTAPTGFVFTGGASYGYYFGAAPHPVGNLNTTLSDGGGTITVHDPLDLNTSPQKSGQVIYTFALRAKPDAVPGTHASGLARVATQTAPLTATVR